jgi:predicted regulator of Ras-like GTPase activity (Roadblock/LC7/MglB family)
MIKRSKIEELANLLKNLKAFAPDIEASAVASADGFMIVSDLPQGAERDRTATLSAAMLLLGESTASELALGELSEVYVKGESGCVILTGPGENTVFAALVRKNADPEPIFPDAKKAAEEVTRIVHD